MASDHFMAGWEARREALRTKDAKAKQRILEDHRVSIALVERVSGATPGHPLVALGSPVSDSLPLPYLPYPLVR